MKFWNKAKSNFQKIHWPGFLLGLVVIVYIINRFWVPPPVIDIDHTKVLFADSTIIATPKEIIEHNELLRELLYKRIDLEYTSSASRESTRQQMRGFYVLIVAGMLSIVIAKRNSNTKASVLTLMALIFVMYMIEVHNLDLDERFRATGKVYSRDLYSLINSKVDSTTWDKFDYNKNIKAELDTADDFEIEWKRKAIKAVRYNAEQAALYILPFVALFWWYFKNTFQHNQKPKKRLLVYRSRRGN